MPHPLLLINDDLAFCQNLQQQAKLRGFVLHHRQSLEEGMELLAEKPEILAVILDTRCHIDDDDNGAAKSNFVLHAITQIQDYEHQMNRSLPYCICTENPEEFTEDFEGIARVFDKNDDAVALFDHVNQLIQMLPRIQAREKFAELFQVFEDFFSTEEEELLTDLVLNLNQSDSVSVISNLTILRRLEESLIALAAIKLLPEIKKGKGPKTLGHARENLRRLNDMKFIDGFRYSFADDIYKVCSRYGSHSPQPNTQTARLPSSDTITGMFYLYADLCCALARHF